MFTFCNSECSQKNFTLNFKKVKITISIYQSAQIYKKSVLGTANLAHTNLLTSRNYKKIFKILHEMPLPQNSSIFCRSGIFEPFPKKKVKNGQNTTNNTPNYWAGFFTIGHSMDQFYVKLQVIWSTFKMWPIMHFWNLRPTIRGVSIFCWIFSFSSII